MQTACLLFTRHVTKGRGCLQVYETPCEPSQHSPDSRQPVTGCTSESLPDPADELLAQGQLPQTLAPGLTDVLQQLVGMDKLLADPLQLLMAIFVKVVSL